jgi:hypothetical protein
LLFGAFCILEVISIIDDVMRVLPLPAFEDFAPLNAILGGGIQVGMTEKGRRVVERGPMSSLIPKAR